MVNFTARTQKVSSWLNGPDFGARFLDPHCTVSNQIHVHMLVKSGHKPQHANQNMAQF
jgi:hypothetical protein